MIISRLLKIWMLKILLARAKKELRNILEIQDPCYRVA